VPSPDEEQPDTEVSGPAWFVRALGADVATGVVHVDGCPIAYRRWGDPGRPGVVLVHGGGAHSRWWDHIAPFFSEECCVAALDLSGHGDSGRRPGYWFETWAAEIVAVADALGGAEPPVVVAHSMGGRAALRAAAGAGGRLKGIIVVDSAVTEVSPEEQEGSHRSAFGPLRLYPSIDDALARFHTVPDQPVVLPWLIDHVARTSLRPIEGGWTWKFDPAFINRLDHVPPDMLSAVSCRVALLRAQFGLLTSDIGTNMYNQLGRNAPVIEIPLAHHHVMLDQPLSLVTAVRTLLADWRHSSVVPPEWA
jgi:pimeloyl-ACP methyl ester carboxylesterase